MPKLKESSRTMKKARPAKAPGGREIYGHAGPADYSVYSFIRRGDLTFDFPGHVVLWNKKRCVGWSMASVEQFAMLCGLKADAVADGNPIDTADRATDKIAVELETPDRYYKFFDAKKDDRGKPLKWLGTRHGVIYFLRRFRYSNLCRQKTDSIALKRLSRELRDAEVKILARWQAHVDNVKIPIDGDDDSNTALVVNKSLSKAEARVRRLENKLEELQEVNNEITEERDSLRLTLARITAREEYLQEKRAKRLQKERADCKLHPHWDGVPRTDAENKTLGRINSLIEDSAPRLDINKSVLRRIINDAFARMLGFENMCLLHKQFPEIPSAVNALVAYVKAMNQPIMIDMFETYATQFIKEALARGGVTNKVEKLTSQKLSNRISELLEAAPSEN